MVVMVMVVEGVFMYIASSRHAANVTTLVLTLANINEPPRQMDDIKWNKLVIIVCYNNLVSAGIQRLSGLCAHVFWKPGQEVDL